MSADMDLISVQCSVCSVNQCSVENWDQRVFIYSSSQKFAYVFFYFLHYMYMLLVLFIYDNFHKDRNNNVCMDQASESDNTIMYCLRPWISEPKLFVRMCKSPLKLLTIFYERPCIFMQYNTYYNKKCKMSFFEQLKREKIQKCLKK